jgi:hypothetical protein
MINKTSILFSFILFFVILTGCGKKDEAKINNNSKVKYTAYYFHPTARCESCLNLEAYIKELIESKYTSKGFVYKSFNIEEKENEHYRKDFNLQFSSVIIENSENKKWKNLDSIWSFTNNKIKFFEYTEKEINQFINN